MSNPIISSMLPSPRDLITSIFNSLPQTAALPEPGESNHASANPPKGFNTTSRSVVVTLHVLFPSLLLQALDLLDRGLVTKAIQVAPSTTSVPPVPPAPPVWPPQTHIHFHAIDQAENDNKGRNETQGVNQGQEENANTFYLVHSAQSSHSRGGSSSSSRYSSASGNSYIVHLTPWNCSCAAFAFSAFPASTSGSFSPQFEATAPQERDVQRVVSEWEFGGQSFDGMEGHGDGVPCCKHLMACLLAERWHGIFGGYVKLQRVGRVEMAGLGGGGV